jgi:hypothetical protein
MTFVVDNQHISWLFDKANLSAKAHDKTWQSAAW